MTFKNCSKTPRANSSTTKSVLATPPSLKRIKVKFMAASGSEIFGPTAPTSTRVPTIKVKKALRDTTTGLETSAPLPMLHTSPNKAPIAPLPFLRINSPDRPGKKSSITSPRPSSTPWKNNAYPIYHSMFSPNFSQLQLCRAQLLLRQRPRPGVDP